LTALKTSRSQYKMGTRRRKLRGGEEFYPKKFEAPAGINATRIVALKKQHDASEKVRYEEWLKRRTSEAKHEMKQRDDKAAELKDLASTSPVKSRIHEEEQAIAEKDIESTRMSDESKRRKECRDTLRSHSPPLGSPKAAKAWLADKANMKSNPQDYAEVRSCVRALEAAGGRRTRRRKTHRRR